MWWRNYYQILFQKIKIGCISRSVVLSFVQFAFILYQDEDYPKYIETKMQTTCFYFIQGFLENKKRSGTGLLVSFFA